MRIFEIGDFYDEKTEQDVTEKEFIDCEATFAVTDREGDVAIVSHDGYNDYIEFIDEKDGKYRIEKESVTENMREAGNQITSALMDAQIAACLGGLGGSNNLTAFEAAYEGDNLDLIKAYLREEIDSVTAIYTAMERVKYLGHRAD